MPGFRLHRAREAACIDNKVATAARKFYISCSVSARSRMRSWPKSSSGREISAGTPGCSSGRSPTRAERIQPACARAREFHLAALGAERFRESLDGNGFRNCRRFPSTTRSWKKADRVLVVEAGFDWDDVGGLASGRRLFYRTTAEQCGQLRDHGSRIPRNNIVFDQDGTKIALARRAQSYRCATGDALLVCHRHQAEKIKHLVGKLPPDCNERAANCSARAGR